MGGELVLDEAYGRGAKFTLTLRRRARPDQDPVWGGLPLFRAS